MEVFDDPSILEKLRCYVLAAVDPERYAHSMRTAQTAAQMCRLYNEDEKAGYFAGLAHDMCKEMSSDMLLLLCSKDGLPLSDIETKKTTLLHGRAAAVLLKKQFGITDERILEAVRWHTFGSCDMGNLAKIVYAADKIEPGRPQYTSASVKKLLTKDLNAVLFFILKQNIEYLVRQKKEVSPLSMDLYKYLQQKKKIGKQGRCSDDAKTI